jgi:hypothetical protein
MDAARERVREVVKGKSRFVREHAFPPRPEPQLGQFLVLGGGVVDDAVDPATHSPHAAMLDVAAKELPVEARRAGLLGREEASLAGRYDEELVPARPFPLDRHSINVNVTLSFVQVHVADRPDHPCVRHHWSRPFLLHRQPVPIHRVLESGRR